MVRLIEDTKNIDDTPHASYLYGVYMDLAGTVYCKGFTYSPEGMSFTCDNLHTSPNASEAFPDYVKRQDNTKTNINNMFGTEMLVGSSLNFYADSYGNVFTGVMNEEYPEYTLHVVRHPKQKGDCTTVNLVANPERYVFKALDRNSTEGRGTVRAYNKQAREDVAILKLLDEGRLEEIYEEAPSDKGVKTEVHKIVVDSRKVSSACSFKAWCTQFAEPPHAKKLALYRMQRDLPKIYTHTVTIRSVRVYSTDTYKLTSKVERGTEDGQ